ncbi:MAG: TetR family transcriptional regulator [Psychromonas sp.]|nr:TetR family transcriptional regulator [Psychromonas sp.]
MSVKKESVGQVRQKNVALILTAAKTEFVTHGFKGASIKRIAERAKIPRANIHYYFDDKTALYQQLLNEIIVSWNTSFDTLSIDDDPKTVLTAYIHEKIMHAKHDPDGSKIFASEIIHGAPILKDYLHTEFKQWLDEKITVINTWIAQGQIDAINPYHLLFLIWSSTQHYADFNVQILAGLGKEKMEAPDFDEVITSITGIILKGCGLA